MAILWLSFGGEGYRATAQYFEQWFIERHGPPHRVHRQVAEPYSRDWIDRIDEASKVSIEWKDDQTNCRVIVGWWGTSSFNEFNVDIDPAEVLQRLSEAPFSVATAGSIHGDWHRPVGHYPRVNTGDFHEAVGWAMFFKGGGHRHLVSRRWLDRGPWRVLRGPNDTTMVQFHDLSADSATALVQARPGHDRMVKDPDAGYISTFARPSAPVEGLYLEDTHQLRVICQEGRDISTVAMTDACKVRFQRYVDRERMAWLRARAARGGFDASPYQVAEGPIVESVAYVFVTEEDARRHLHELWLRDLECWSLEGGKEVRLDLDYEPPPPHTPDWVPG